MCITSELLFCNTQLRLHYGQTYDISIFRRSVDGCKITDMTHIHTHSCQRGHHQPHTVWECWTRHFIYRHYLYTKIYESLSKQKKIINISNTPKEFLHESMEIENSHEAKASICKPEPRPEHFLMILCSQLSRMLLMQLSFIPHYLSFLILGIKLWLHYSNYELLYRLSTQIFYSVFD